MDEFPKELKEKPKAFVGVVGLNLENANHKAVWDTLSRPQEYSAISFKILGPNYKFPPPKPKKQYYERYVPRGILKKGWVNKHLNEIPAVVAIFFELDLVNTSEWQEKKAACVEVIQKIRNALVNRDTRMALILLQRESSLPPGDDVVVSERAAALCNMANINSKAFYMLPCSDHLRQYIIRIEVALLELAQSYYANAAKVVKNHKDFLNETNHMVLYVRHPFKMAFHHEMKQDLSSALKLYQQAYGQVFRMRFSDANLHEIKTVAGIINYKICHLQFRNNVPRDAIIQYKKHMDAFKNLIGPADLAFEHWAWLSRQAELFGEIFEEAIQLGLEAAQTQHPGVYYDQAVQFSYSRKNHSIRLCSNATVLPSPNPLSEASNVDYYGQRPWRGNRHTMEISDQNLEKQGIMALQFMERSVNHSEIIISQLINSIAQYKKYNCPRTTRKLNVLMAQEFTVLKDYKKALTILMGVLWQYRSDKWWIILTDILQKAYQLALCTTSSTEYVGLGLELLNNDCLLSKDKKIKVLNDLKKVSMGLAPQECDTSNPLWEIAKVSPIITVDITDYMSCIQCKTRFHSSTVSADSTGTIDVYLWYDGPESLELSKMTINLNSSQFGVIVSSEPIILMPGQFYLRSVNYTPSPQDVGREIQVTSVSADIGTSITLRWMDGCSSYVSHDITVPKLIVMGLNKDDPCYKFQTVVPCSNVLISPRSSELDVSIIHCAPSLVGEWYPMTINIKNTEEDTICDVILDFNLSHHSERNLEQTTLLTARRPDESEMQPGRLHHINLGKMEPNEEKNIVFYMKATSEGLRNYLLRIFYDITVMSGTSSFVCHCNKEMYFDVQVVFPFHITDSKLSLMLDPIVLPAMSEPFILMCNVDCLSPWPLVLQDSKLQFGLGEYKLADGGTDSQLRGVSINNGEKAAECFCIVADPSNKFKQIASDSPCFNVYWRRKDNKDVPLACTSVPILVPPASTSMIYVDADVPSNGWVRTPLHVKYCLYNRGARILDLKVTIEPNEMFMISGNRTFRLRILPESKQVITFNLYPLQAGQVPIPKLKLITITGDEDGNSHDLILESTLKRLLPSHIFILPQSKKVIPAGVVTVM